jgi:hypothetical protein
MEHATRNDEPTDEMKLLKAFNLLLKFRTPELGKSG